MTQLDENEEKLLRSVALQNAKAVLLARERAERELLLAHQRISNILESITDGFCALDKDWKFIFLNSQAAEILRPLYSSKESLVGVSHWDAFPDTLGTPLEANYRRAMREQVTVHFEFFYPALKVWFDIRAYPSPDGLSIYFLDITQRKRDADQIRQQREWFEVTLGSIGDSVIATDLNGRITFLNPVAETMTGWKSIEAVGQPLETVFKIIHEQTRRPAVNPISKVLEQGKVVELANHTALLTRDGLEIAIEDSAAPIRDAQGNLAGAVMVFHDVTARRRAEIALRESEERLRAVFNQAAVGIAVKDLDGRFVEVNKKFTEILGYSLKELQQMTVGELTHPDDRARTKENMRRLLQGEVQHYVVEKRFIQKGGASIWTLTTVTLIKDPEQNPVRFIAVVEDISARKEAEEARRDSSQRLQIALSAAQLGDWMWDAKADRVTFGQRGSEFFGLPNDTPVSRAQVQALLHEEDRERARSAMDQALSLHTDYDIDYRVLNQSGGYRWVAAKGRGVYAEDGTMLGMTGVVQDITSRKEAEDRLRQSGEELRALANSIPQLAWIAEPDGHIFWYNRKWFEYTGTTLEQMKGWGWQSVHDPQILPQVLQRWKLSIGSGEPFEMEFPLRGADGVFRWFLTRVNPVRDQEGRVLRWFGTNTNVDEVRKAREALREETRILEILNDTGTAIAAKLDLQNLVQTVTDSATKLTGAKFGAFFYNVVNQEGESFLLYTLSGAPREAFEKFGLPRNTPVFNPTFCGQGIVRSADITQDPRYGTMSPHHGMPKGHLPVRSYLAVPVISRTGEVIGGLFFGHPEPDIFTEKAERLAAGVAAQAAIAIDNARLYDAAQKEIAKRSQAEEALAGRIQLTVLRAEISAALAVNQDLQIVLQSCTEALVKHIDAAFARIWTLSEQQILELRASSGLYRHLDGPHSRIRLGEFKIGRIAKNREPHLTNDVQHDQEISDPDWARREGMVAFAGYPLVVDDHVMGVVAIFARRPLPEEVLKELSLLADGLAQWIQRKQAEQALQVAQEKLSRHAEELEKQVTLRTASLREAIAQLEEFSYSVSHDLRAPLRAISGYTKIFSTDYGAALPAEAHSYLEKILRSTGRMDRLVNDVLTMSRVARAEIRLHPIALQPFIEEIVEQHVAMQPPAAEVTISTPHRVCADDASLNQAMANLLANAVKFVHPGSKASVKVFSELQGDRVRIWVEDQGIGIKANEREKLFGMFQRLPSSLQYEGTGIGLAIVRRAVDRMGGTVGVESDGLNGSRFWMELKGV